MANAGRGSPPATVREGAARERVRAHHPTQPPGCQPALRRTIRPRPGRRNGYVCPHYASEHRSLGARAHLLTLWAWGAGGLHHLASWARFRTRFGHPARDCSFTLTEVLASNLVGTTGSRCSSAGVGSWCARFPLDRAHWKRKRSGAPGGDARPFLVMRFGSRRSRSPSLARADPSSSLVGGCSTSGRSRWRPRRGIYRGEQERERQASSFGNASPRPSSEALRSQLHPHFPLQHAQRGATLMHTDVPAPIGCSPSWPISCGPRSPTGPHEIPLAEELALVDATSPSCECDSATADRGDP